MHRPQIKIENQKHYVEREAIWLPWQNYYQENIELFSINWKRYSFKKF